MSLVHTIVATEDSIYPFVSVGREGNAWNLCQSRRYIEMRAWRRSLVWRGGTLEEIDWVESDLKLGRAATVSVRVSYLADLSLRFHLHIIEPFSTLSYLGLRCTQFLPSFGMNLFQYSLVILLLNFYNMTLILLN